MRVLFLSPVGVIGGAERVLLDLLASLRGEAGVEARLCALARGPLVDAARSLGVVTEVVEIPQAWADFGESGLSRGGSLRVLARTSTALRGASEFLSRLRGQLSSFRPDVVHSNGVKTHWLASLLVPRKVPLVVHVHDYLSERKISRFLVGALKRRRAVLVANSASVASDIRSLGWKAELTTILNGIDLDRFSPGEGDSAWLAREAGMSQPRPGEICVALVATYADWKGQDVAISALSELCRSRPDLSCRLYVVGGPIYKTKGSQFALGDLRALAAAHGVEARVGFVPFQEDTPKVYRSVDLVIHASRRREAFGLTIAEAMACGKPVIVSCTGGAAELFQEGESALGFAPGDTSGLAKALGRLIADAPLRARLGNSARFKAERDFDRSRLGREFATLYTRLGRPS
jgi:glycosyltransferase involved in cell wall biosynthesis